MSGSLRARCIANRCRRRLVGGSDVRKLIAQYSSKSKQDIPHNMTSFNTVPLAKSHSMASTRRTRPCAARLLPQSLNQTVKAIRMSRQTNKKAIGCLVIKQQPY